MSIRYAHTNIISKDWQMLAKFYEIVFECTVVPPQRKLSGNWLADGTGVNEASLEGVHLRLPGYGDSGPTLEIYSYSQMVEKPTPPVANRAGFGHIAFAVDDVQATIDHVLEQGGGMLGQVVTQEISDAGCITFAYVTDPEGNIIEIQKWAS